MPRLLFALLLLPFPLLAADPPPAHRAAGDRALAARRVLVKYCAECHAEPKGANRLSVLDHRILVGTGGPRAFVNTEQGRSQVVEFLDEGSMPPGGRPRPTADDIKAVREWVDAGAKEYPAKLDDAAVLALIAADLKEQPKPGEVRYVSLAHLADADPAKVAAAEAELAEAFAPLVPKGETAWEALAPLPESANTVYRLNVSKLHWDSEDLFNRFPNGNRVADLFPIVPFDLIHIENPHPPAGLDAKAAEEVVRKMNPHRGDKLPLAQLRAVPFVRGDWLTKALRKDGKPTPLADELAALTELDPAIRREDKNIPGPTPRSLFLGGDVGPGESVWAWYRPGTTMKNPPFKLTALLKDPSSGSIPEGGGGVVIEAKADKAAAVTLVEVRPGTKASVMPLEKGSGSKLVAGADVVVLSPNKEGVYKLVAPPGTVFFLVIATAEPLKAPPVVVGSRHAPGTVIFRVLPSEQDADAMPAAVRAVLPVGVKKEE